MRIIKNVLGVVSVLGIAGSAFAQSVDTPGTIAPISIINAGAYTQTFDGGVLASTPNGGLDATLPAGWGFAEFGGQRDATYRISDGTTTETQGQTVRLIGDTYSFGAVGSSERSLGGGQTSALKPTWGVLFQNNTGATITSFTVSYVGETWYKGVAGVDTDRIDFQFAVIAGGASITNPFGNNSLFSGAANQVDALDYTEASSATQGALDGNLSANRQLKLGTITPTGGVLAGQVLAIRFDDFNRTTNVESGLSVDDFTIQANYQPVPAPPAAVSVGIAGLVGLMSTGVGKLRARRRKQAAK